jgi:hypothetical protein
MRRRTTFGQRSTGGCHMCRIPTLACFIVVLLVADYAEARRLRFSWGFSVNRGMVTTSKSYGPDVLTVQQLEHCLRWAYRLDQDSTAIDSRRERLIDKLARIDLYKTELDRLERSLDRYSQVAIDRFNAIVTRFNWLVDETRTNQATFNFAVERHNDGINAYKASCAKKYYADDLEAAKRATGLE